MSEPGSYASRFAEYFRRPVALSAAKPLSRKAQIQLRIVGSGSEEAFYFAKSSDQGEILPGNAPDADVEFRMTARAADEILTDPSEEIGAIGVRIAKLIASPDADRKIHVRLKAGFLTLFNKGYLGVVSAGGAQFAGFLASKGLGGLSAIKDTIAKLRSSG